MKKICVFLAVFIIALPLLYAQDYKGRARLRGVVTDLDGNPIEGVKVRLVYSKVNEGFEVMTDSGGRWVASWLKGGKWDVDFEKMGYSSKKISITVKEGTRNADVGIELEKLKVMTMSEELKEYLDKANSLYEEGKFDESIQAYKDALEKFPDVFITNANIGNVYFKMKDYDQAIAYYQKVIERDPANNEVKIYIGNSYSNKGDSEKAQEWYDKVDFEKIEDVNVLYNIGTDFYSKSKFEQALKYYKRAVELKGDFLDAVYYLGLSYLSNGNNEEALATFEKYLQQDSDSERASQVEGFIDYLKK
jgi:Tfp pilus assembly protein PilF